jgi:hypothetical protein
MCVNIPIEVWASDASRFVDWSTPKTNASRASNLAALLGLIYTPLSKGWLSGSHEEIKRAEGESGSADGATRSGEKFAPKRVFRYMFISDSDPRNAKPMFVIMLERIYKSDRKTVCAIRVWHHIFDENHSTSGLMRKLMEENQDSTSQQGYAHAPNALRRSNIVADGKKARVLADGFNISDVRLEMFAGTQFMRVSTESHWMNMLSSCCGASDASAGRHFVPNFEVVIPPGAFNDKLRDTPKVGSMHPASPEWLLNGKRWEALQAGLVHLDGTPMDEDQSQINTSNYWNDDGFFRVPGWIAELDGCHAMTDPNIRNVFDAALPYAVKNADKPGDSLLELFREQFAPNMAIGSDDLVDAFSNKLTGVDQTTQRSLMAMTESIASFDTLDMSDDERKTMRMATSNGIRNYGRTDEECDVLEPVQKLKDLAYQTCEIQKKVVSPWAHEQRKKLEEKARVLNDKSPKSEHDLLEKNKAKFYERHNAVMKDLAELHLSRINTAFNSKSDRSTIPVGYRAVYDGLMEELKNTPNQTANIGVAFDMQMMDSDRTAFAHISDWIFNFFEHDCFVEGRDWRIMQELFYHCFEQFSEQTLLLILCGPKGARFSFYICLQTVVYVVTHPQATARACAPSAQRKRLFPGGLQCRDLLLQRRACRCAKRI